MRLNEHCMTDIIEYCIKNIHVEENGNVYSSCRLLTIPQQLSMYDEEIVLYSLVKLIEMNYIIIDTKDNIWDEYTYVVDVTYHGHKYYEKQLSLYNGD